MARLKPLEFLAGSAADKAETRLSKLSAQLAETDREIEAAETRRTIERKALVEALGNGDDASGPEAALAEVAGTVARLTERREVLADLVEKATVAAQEARRASTLGKAREVFEEARLDAQERESEAVAAFLSAGKVAGRYAEAVRRCDGAAASVAALDPDGSPVSGPALSSFPFVVARAAEAEGLRPVGSMPVTLDIYPA